MRTEPLSSEERDFLRQNARYEGSPYHKRNPGDFGLTPPFAPRLDKTLCEEGGVTQLSQAKRLLALAIERGLVSEAAAEPGFPKELWVMDERGQVFEAMYGGSQRGAYHGYPVRQGDPLFKQVEDAWKAPE